MRIGVQFSRQAGLLSGLIAYRGGRFSHADVILHDGRLLGARSDRVGGCPSGVQIRPPHYAEWVEVDRVFLDVPADHARAFHDFLMAQLNKPYDSVGICAFIFGIAHDRNWREKSAWFCSELVCAALEHAKIVRRLTLDAFKIDPGGLSLVASAIGFK